LVQRAHPHFFQKKLTELGDESPVGSHISFKDWNESALVGTNRMKTSKNNSAGRTNAPENNIIPFPLALPRSDANPSGDKAFKRTLQKRNGAKGDAQGAAKH
jgi:hypothetical protein